MEQIAKLDKRKKTGFTIIEILISILLLLIISLALLQAVTYFIIKTTEINLKNEAVKIAKDCAEAIRHLDQCITSASGNLVNGTIVKKLGNSSYNFNIIYTNPDYFHSGYNDAIVVVKYNYRGREYLYKIVTTVYKK